ncbi:MAG: hypothetical protein KKD17_02875 [Nanoarchaeota archaeon]|nr:hypothetical protein [Nanoarchaeota archaeon]
MNVMKKIKSMFADKKLKLAFRTIKTDMELIQENHNALKGSVNEWVIFLDQENRDLKMRVRELEKKLDALENSLDEKELAMLRGL